MFHLARHECVSLITLAPMINPAFVYRAGLSLGRDTMTLTTCVDEVLQLHAGDTTNPSCFRNLQPKLRVGQRGSAPTLTLK